MHRRGCTKNVSKLKNVHHPADSTQALVTKPTIYNAIMRMMLYGETWQRMS